MPNLSRHSHLQGTFRAGKTLIPYQIVRCRQQKRNMVFDHSTGRHMMIRVPERISQGRIDATLQNHRDWLVDQWNERPAPTPLRKWRSGEKITVYGKKYRLRTMPYGDDEVICQKTGELIEVYYPRHEGRDVEVIRAAVIDWLRHQAQRILRQRVKYWAAKMNVKPKRVMITDTRMRWGSCTFDNDLRFNWRVILAEPRVLDYLVVHELAHIRHKDHSPRFWNFVAKFLPDMDVLRDKLDALRIEI